MEGEREETGAILSYYLKTTAFFFDRSIGLFKAVRLRRQISVDPRTMGFCNPLDREIMRFVKGSAKWAL